MIFKIGTHDFSKCVVMGSYNMTKQDVFHEYTDANGVKHRNIYRTRCSGSLQLYFRTNELLNEFIDALKEKASGGYNVVTATINNTNEDVSFNAYLGTTEMTRNTVGTRDTIQAFSLSVEER